MGIVTDTVVGTLGKVIDRVLPDPAARDAANLALLQLNQTGELAQLTADTDLGKGQLAVDAAEASSTSPFVSGWRPFIGWVCGAGLAYQFVIAPVMSWAAALFGHAIAMPVLDLSTLLTLLLGMLGLGGLRTVEKINKVAA